MNKIFIICTIIALIALIVSARTSVSNRLHSLRLYDEEEYSTSSINYDDEDEQHNTIKPPKVQVSKLLPESWNKFAQRYATYEEEDQSYELQASTTYTVVSGDTLSRIAKRFGMFFSTLCFNCTIFIAV